MNSIDELGQSKLKEYNVGLILEKSSFVKTLPITYVLEIIQVYFLGVGKTEISMAMMATGAAEMFCRVGNGYLVDRKIISPYLHYCIASFAAGSAILVCALFPGLSGAVYRSNSSISTHS